MAGQLRLALVLEHSLGHVAHARNVERALARRADIDATVIGVEYDRAGGPMRHLPGLRNWSLRGSLAARSELRRRLRQGPLDAVFIHTQVVSLLSGPLMREVPAVVSLDATPANFDELGLAYGHHRQAAFVERLKRDVNRRVLLGASGLVTWSRWARDSLVRDYGVPVGKVTVIHPGVDTSLFRPGTVRRPGPPRVLFVGGDFERKGGGDLIEAVRVLGSEVELDLVTGSAPPALAGRPGIRVHAGLRPQSPALVDLYRQADVFVLPTRGDCFGQVIEEAMACGLPVIATQMGAVGDMVQHGVTGLLVPPASPPDLALALGRFLRDPALRSAMGRQGLVAALRDHDARRNCNAIFDLLAAVAAEKRSLPRVALR